MNYEYKPNTIDKKLLEEKGINERDLISLQVRYKNALESIIKEVIDVKEIDNLIESVSFEIPTNLDEDSFYSHFSSLKSKYFYVRNNIHIERLSKEDIETLKTNDNHEELVLRTLREVISEKGDMVCYGAALPKYFAPSRDLVIVFAYKKAKCTIKENKEFSDKIEEVFERIKSPIESKLNIKVSKIIYDGYEKAEGIIFQQ